MLVLMAGRPHATLANSRPLQAHVRPSRLILLELRERDASRTALIDELGPGFRCKKQVDLVIANRGEIVQVPRKEVRGHTEMEECAPSRLGFAQNIHLLAVPDRGRWNLNPPSFRLRPGLFGCVTPRSYNVSASYSPLGKPRQRV
jgi:hypothetical protein